MSASGILIVKKTMNLVSDYPHFIMQLNPFALSVEGPAYLFPILLNHDVILNTYETNKNILQPYPLMKHSMQKKWIIHVKSVLKRRHMKKNSMHGIAGRRLSIFNKN